jgi:hypothetical protein
MNRTCSQCQFPFIESTIAYYRRMINGSPILCNSCYRIKHAEDRAKKRLLKMSKSQNDKCVKITHPMDKYVRNPNIKVSVCYLQRKYKITYEEAKEWMKTM